MWKKATRFALMKAISWNVPITKMYWSLPSVELNLSTSLLTERRRYSSSSTVPFLPEPTLRSIFRLDLDVRLFIHCAMTHQSVHDNRRNAFLPGNPRCCRGSNSVASKCCWSHRDVGHNIHIMKGLVVFCSIKRVCSMTILRVRAYRKSRKGIPGSSVFLMRSSRSLLTCFLICSLISPRSSEICARLSKAAG